MSSLNYFTCKKSAEHESEYLDSVCLESECPDRGLLCSLCRSNHSNHTIVPLKKFLRLMVKENSIHVQKEDGLDAALRNLDAIKDNHLCQLRIWVESLAAIIKTIQEQILSDYREAKQNLVKRAQFVATFDEIVRKSFENGYQLEKQFQNDMTFVLSMLKARPEHKFDFDIDLTVPLRAFEEQGSQYSSGTAAILASMDQLGERLLKTKLSLSSAPVEPSEAKVNKISAGFKFSSQYKGPSIVLDGEKIARQSITAPSRFVMVDAKLGKQPQTIAFKIMKLSNWVGIGIGLRDKLKEAKYQFNYNTPKHGGYLLSNNGFMWSHSVKEQNLATCDFGFKEGEVIEVTFSQNELKFVNRNSKKEQTLKVSLEQAEWKQVCFCANLCSAGDTVKIVE